MLFIMTFAMLTTAALHATMTFAMLTIAVLHATMAFAMLTTAVLHATMAFAMHWSGHIGINGIGCFSDRRNRFSRFFQCSLLFGQDR